VSTKALAALSAASPVCVTIVLALSACAYASPVQYLVAATAA
jgi:hypothetical protein